MTHRWAGIFGLVLDFFRSSVQAPAQPGAWVCGGYSGHGNVLGFMCGDLVAKAMLGEEHPLSRCSTRLDCCRGLVFARRGLSRRGRFGAPPTRFVNHMLKRSGQPG